MKIDRLMGIVVYLLNHGRTSAQKLAEEFEVSSRTIVRDLGTLDMAGIPIQSFYGVDGGYQLMEDYVFEKQIASRHEYDWIVAALQGMASAYANKSLSRTLAKIQSIAPKEASAVSMDLSVATEDDNTNQQLALLEEAIRTQHMVRFSYTNSHDEVKERLVEPVCLKYQWYNWYLIAYYEKYQDYCMFKLVRVEHVEITGMQNTKVHNLADIKLKEGNEKIFHIRLLGKASIKAKCREYLNGQITREFAGGDFEFCFSVPEHETFWYGALLSFGNKVKILEPQELKERILQTCKETMQVYETEAEFTLQPAEKEEKLT